MEGEEQPGRASTVLTMSRWRDWDRMKRETRAAKDLSESQKRTLAYERYLEYKKHHPVSKNWVPKWLK